MGQKKKVRNPGPIARMIEAEEQIAGRVAVPFIRPRNFVCGTTATDVMKHMAFGAGAAARRSGKGGKGGGGLGGQQAGGVKGGSKRKTHAGRK